MKQGVIMSKRNQEIGRFIRLIRGISPSWLRYACTKGGCYRFYLVLKDRFPSAKPYILRGENDSHVITKINGIFWDIWGEHDPKEDGKPHVMTALDTKCMSSCYFDEAFVLANPHFIREQDYRKPKQRAEAKNGG